MLKDYPDIMTPKQVAEVLGLGKNKVNDLLKSKTIGNHRVGRKYLVPKICVIDYMQSARYTVAKP